MKIRRPYLQFMTEPEGGDPAPSGGDPAPVAGSDPQPEALAAEDLGDAGKKAIQSERDARKKAEKQVSELQAKIDAHEAEKLTELEKAQKEAADAQEAAATARSEALIFQALAKFDLDESDAELLSQVSGKDAVFALAERLSKSAHDDALNDPGAGGGKPAGKSHAEPGVPRLAAAFESEMG